MNAGFRTTEGLLVVGGEGSMPRLYVEQRKLTEHFPQFRLVANGPGDVVGAAGTLCTNSSGSYEVRILLPSDYPYSMPKAEQQISGSRGTAWP